MYSITVTCECTISEHAGWYIGGHVSNGTTNTHVAKYAAGITGRVHETETRTTHRSIHSCKVSFECLTFN